MPIFLPARFFLGLTAYVRQAALSLDRVDGHYRPLIAEFVRETPNLVLGKLDELERRSASKSLPMHLTLWMLGREVALVPTDFTATRQALVEFERLIFGDEAEDQARRIAVRLQLSRGESRLARKLGRRDRNLVDQVEHYYQSSESNLPIDEIAGTGWISGS